MLTIALLAGQPEIFYSIQGEGKNTGIPSVFIRLSQCNLYCYWCDTDYTWNWQGTRYAHQRDNEPGYQKYRKEDMMVRMSATDILAAVKQYPCRHLIFTGGEPLMQRKQLFPLLKLLKEADPGYHIAFETNGTILPGPEIDAYTDQYNVSVKLENALVSEIDRISEKAVSFFSCSEKANFKFVVDSPDDLEEVLQLAGSFRISPEKIYLMPQGTHPASLKEKQQWLIELCKIHGFRYTDRLHIHVFGNKRGV